MEEQLLSLVITDCVQSWRPVRTKITMVTLHVFFPICFLLLSDISKIGASESLMNQHDGFSSVWFMKRQRWRALPSSHIYLCNAADIIYRSNGKPHDSAEPKSASVWESQAPICLSGRRTRHKPFCALRYQPLQFPPAPLFTLMSH